MVGEISRKRPPNHWSRNAALDGHISWLLDGDDDDDNDDCDQDDDRFVHSCLWVVFSYDQWDQTPTDAFHINVYPFGAE
jgi:hypothetical protein